MIVKCLTENAVAEILDYIGDDRTSVPYLYVDVVKYGIGAENVRTWIDRAPDGALQGVYLLYYDCLHFFSRKESSYPAETFLNAVEFLNPKVIMLRQKMGDCLKTRLCDAYILERNYIVDLDHLKPNNHQETVCEVASRDDIKKMVDLMMTEPIYSSVYDRDTLEKQMLERYDDHFSSYFVIKDGQELAAAYSTFAEVPRMILLGSLIVNPTCRGKGYAGKLMNYACRILSGDGATKLGFINYENTASLRSHEKIGSFPIGTLYKFVKA